MDATEAAALTTNIIISAAAAAGDPSDPNYQVKVAGAAIDIAAMANPKSGIADAVTKALLADQVFPAVLVGLDKEASSTRGLLSFRTTPSERYPDGIEPGRTERTDSPAGRAVALKARGLIGHRVLAYRVQEKMGTGASAKSVRVIVALVDLGPAEDKDAIKAAPVNYRRSA